MKIPALQKQYDGRMVLDTPELTLEKGKLYALLGANGSGKSTFARILAGIISSDNHRRLPENCRVGYLPQKGYVFRTTVLKNILLGNGDEKKAQELIRDFSLEDLKRQQARSLSGGEIQRMCLARILMKTYDLLILDEPTSAMDRKSILRSEEILGERRNGGDTILLITHSVQQASRLADEVILLDGGKLIEQGAAGEVLHAPKMPETREFLEFFGVIR